MVQPLKLCLGGSTTTTSASSSQSNNQRKRHRQDSDSSYSSICTFIYLSIYFLLLLQSNFDKMNIKTNWWSNFTLYQFDSNYSRISFIEGFCLAFQAGQVYVKYLFLYESICICDGHWKFLHLESLGWLLQEYNFQMGRGFQVWKFHLKISPWEEKPCLLRAYNPWEASFSSRGLIFGGEEISIPETLPIRKSYIGCKSFLTK